MSTEQEKEIIRQYKEEFYPVPCIAAFFGITEAAVLKIIEKYGVTRRKIKWIQ